MLLPLILTRLGFRSVVSRMSGHANTLSEHASKLKLSGTLVRTGLVACPDRLGKKQALRLPVHTGCATCSDQAPQTHQPPTWTLVCPPSSCSASLHALGTTVATLPLVLNLEDKLKLCTTSVSQ